MNNLILDTCALIWLSQGGGELSRPTIKAIDEANVVYFSTISAWEISLLVSKNQIKLPHPPIEWLTKVSEVHNLETLDISLEIALKSNELPWHHRDPADRFIISTAATHDLVVVTRDKKFSLYDIQCLP